MNGEVNGSVEAMDTSSPPMSPPPAADGKQLSNEPDSILTNDHCDDSNITHPSNISENSNHMDSDHSNSPSENRKTNFSNYEEHKNDHTIDTVNESNSVTANNHCDNSNESSADSTSSSQHKAESELALIQGTSHQVEDNDEDSEDEDDSEEDSSDDEGSVGSEGPRAEDTVSVNSDSDPEAVDDDSIRQGQPNPKNNDIMTIDNVDRISSQNGDTRESQSPEVHEIDSDNEDGDCIVTSEDKADTVQAEPKVESHRRSSRSVKRTTFHGSVENGDKESDLEEISTDDPLNSTRRNKPIVVNDTKALVEMASKQIKEGKGGNEPTVVIIDTNSIISSKSLVGTQPSKSNVSSLVAAQNLYQSIAARGTTVTPVSSKQSSSTQVQTTPPIILPSLTDDMYVVEAPSFIVPYVYEKPSVKPFREFVDILGRDLDLEREKEEAKEREEKERRAKERKERGEEPEDSDKESDKEPPPPPPEEIQEEPKKKKTDKKSRKRGRDDDDDASWDGETSSESEDEAISDDDTRTTVVIKEKDDDALEKIKNTITVTDLTESTKLPGIKTDNYFDNALGKFFINIGVNLVQEYVQADLLKQQKRKLHRETKAGATNTKATESAIMSLSKNLLFSKENNAPYAFPQKRCKFCSFKTESMLAMSHHLETPHMKNNVYNCNFCPFEIRSPHDILYHMEEQHNTRGRLERAPAYHQCANCPFEDNGKGKLARHLIPCAKKFKPELNLAPPVEWEPPAKIPKVARARSNMMGGYQTAFNRPPVAQGMPRIPLNMAGMIPGIGGGFRMRGRSPMGSQPRGAPMQGAPLVRGGVMMRHNAPVLMPNNYPLMNAQSSKGSSPRLHQPSISITPLPRAPQPSQQPSTPHAKGTFVICEICDGYIKDLEQLRNHMQWIHKVKIHPKMIYNRPPLNCQKCQFRFFTDQGLERHLLGSHGLVTSSMQEAANKGKDAGRCPVCGRVYQWKLLNHVARDHNLTLKPAHLSYKCTVCTATFSMYKQFENHVYSAHSVVAKKVMDKGKAAPAATVKPVGNDTLLKPLKINDEITIIPQPSKVPTKGKKD